MKKQKIKQTKVVINSKIKNWLLRHTITVFSCVLIIALGITALTYADPVTTTIGENISTNDLSVAGNVTSGTWQGSAVGTQYGGTGQDWSAVTQGNIPYFSDTGTLSNLAPGTTGQFLSQGSDGNPTWDNVTRSATFVVCANDSLNKTQCDYVCDGVDDQVEIQAAIDKGGDIYLMGGHYSKSNVSPITIGSNTSVRLAADAEIKFVDSVGDGAVMFANADADGNENIQIVGGTLNGNRANQPTGEHTAIQLTNVSNSIIDTMMINFRSYNVHEITPGVGCDINNRKAPSILSPPTNILNKMESHPLRELIDDFEDDWDVVTDTVSYDTTIKHSGTRSVKMVAVGSGGTNGAARIEKAVLPTLDESDMSHGLWVYSDNMYNVDQLNIFLRSGGSWSNYTKKHIIYGVDDRKFANNKWIFMGVKESGGSDGTPDLSAIDMIRIELKSRADTTATVWLDKLVHAPKTIAPYGMVTFVFDDAFLSGYTKAKPIFDKYDVPACSAVPVIKVGTDNHMTVSQLKELQEGGWDIIPHSVSHSYSKDGINTEDSYALIEEELIGSQNWAIKNGFRNGARFYIMPGGYYSDKYLDIIEKHFVAARGFGHYMSGESLPLFDPRVLSCRSAGSGQDAASLKTIIDEAYDEKRWLILVIHEVVDSGEPCDVAKLEELVEYVKGKNMPIITFSRMFDDVLFST